MPRRLPDWPRVLPEQWAAVYVGLSAASFRRGPAKELQPVRLSAARKGYLREDLDAWVDRQAGRDNAAVPEGNVWDSLHGANRSAVPAPIRGSR